MAVETEDCGYQAAADELTRFRTSRDRRQRWTRRSSAAFAVRILGSNCAHIAEVPVRAGSLDKMGSAALLPWLQQAVPRGRVAVGEYSWQ